MQRGTLLEEMHLCMRAHTMIRHAYLALQWRSLMSASCVHSPSPWSLEKQASGRDRWTTNASTYLGHFRAAEEMHGICED